MDFLSIYGFFIDLWIFLSTIDFSDLLIFDDFLWPCYRRWRANPAWPINVFLKYRAGEYKILNAYLQIILQKKITFTDHVTPEVAMLSGQGQE